MYSTKHSILNMSLLWVNGQNGWWVYHKLMLPVINKVSILLGKYFVHLFPVIFPEHYSKISLLVNIFESSPSPPANLHHLEINSHQSFEIEHRDGQWSRCRLWGQIDPKSGGLVYSRETVKQWMRVLMWTL